MNVYICSAVAILVAISLVLMLIFRDDLFSYTSLSSRGKRDCYSVKELTEIIGRIEHEDLHNVELRRYLMHCKDQLHRMNALCYEIERLQERNHVSYSCIKAHMDSISKRICSLLSEIVDSLEDSALTHDKIDSQNIERLLVECKQLLSDLDLSKTALQYRLMYDDDSEEFSDEDLMEIIEQIRIKPARKRVIFG